MQNKSARSLPSSESLQRSGLPDHKIIWPYPVLKRPNPLKWEKPEFTKVNVDNVLVVGLQTSYLNFAAIL